MLSIEQILRWAERFKTAEEIGQTVVDGARARAGRHDA